MKEQNKGDIQPHLPMSDRIPLTNEELLDKKLGLENWFIQLMMALQKVILDQ